MREKFAIDFDLARNSVINVSNSGWRKQKFPIPGLTVLSPDGGRGGFTTKLLIF